MPHKNETFLLKISKSYLLMSEKTITLTGLMAALFWKGEGRESKLLYGLCILQRDCKCRFIAFDCSCLERVQVDRQSQSWVWWLGRQGKRGPCTGNQARSNWGYLIRRHEGNKRERLSAVILTGLVVVDPQVNFYSTEGLVRCLCMEVNASPWHSAREEHSIFWRVSGWTSPAELSSACCQTSNLLLGSWGLKVYALLPSQFL